MRRLLFAVAALAATPALAQPTFTPMPDKAPLHVVSPRKVTISKATSPTSPEADQKARVAAGLSYLRGEGGDTAKPELGQVMLEQAAAEGSADAMFWLGEVHAAGTGVARDPARAVTWYQQAATAGDTRAMVRLATHFMTGNGVGFNLAKAFEWLSIAVNSGDDTAKPIRDSLAARLTPADPEAATLAVENFRPRRPGQPTLPTPAYSPLGDAPKPPPMPQGFGQ